MKKGLTGAMLFVLILSLSANVTGNAVIKETRSVKDFSRISFGIAGNLYINIGPTFKVELEGDKSDLENIETVVSGDRLQIKTENFRWGNQDKVDVYITLPELKGLGVSGSGRAEIKDPVKTGSLGLSVSGSGRLYTSDISVSSLECSISGSGDIIFGGSGSASKAEIGISGSGSYSGEALKIESAEISISGSGSCSCTVSGSLEASVSGSGNITYSGNPKIDARVSGSGKVRSR